MVSLVALLLLMAVGGIAAASWLVDGSGPASAQAASVVQLAVASGTPTDWLYPGSTGNLYAVVSNPNSFPVQVTTVALGAVTITPLSGQTCAAGSVTVVPGAALAGPVTLAAGATAVGVTIPNAVQMSSTAGNGCQDAGITVQATFSGTTG